MPQINTASVYTQSSGDNTPSERRRQLARLLLARGLDDSPIQHPTQGAARMAHALIAGLEMRRADEEDKKFGDVLATHPDLVALRAGKPAEQPKADAGFSLASLLAGLGSGSSPMSAPSGFDPDNIGATPASFTPPAMSPVAPPPVIPPVMPPQTMPRAAPPQQPEPQYNPLDPNVAEWREPNNETPVRELPVRTASLGGGPLAPEYANQIKKFEGYAPKAQWDYKQHSNGYGTRAQFPGETIDRETAEQRFQAEISKASAFVNEVVPNAPDPVKAALTSLTYNAGGKWASSGLGELAKQGDWNGVANRLLEYNKAGGQTLPGLVSRRQQEASWISNPPVAGAPQNMPQQYASLNPLDPNPVDQRQMMQPASPMTPNIDYGPNAAPVGTTQGLNAPMAQAQVAPQNVQVAQAQIPGQPQQPPVDPRRAAMQAYADRMYALGPRGYPAAMQALQQLNPSYEYKVVDGKLLQYDTRNPSGGVKVAYEADAPTVLTTPEQRAKYGIKPDDQSHYQVSRAKGLEVIGKPLVSIDQRAGDTFKTKANEFMVERYGGMVKSADAAREMAGDIQILRSTMNNLETGRLAEAKLGAAQWAKAIGANDIADKLTDGKLSEYEAVAALVDKLTPRMRVPGSGTSSDRDMSMFRNSLPSLLRTPGGNNIVMATFESMYDHQMRSGEIAERVLRGDMTQDDGNKALRSLGTPFGLFNEFMKANKVEQRQPNNAAPTLDDLLKKYGR